MCFGGCLDLSILKLRNIYWFFWDSSSKNEVKINWNSEIWIALKLLSFFYSGPWKVCVANQIPYRANIIRHFIFVFFLYFFYHSSCRKDQFTVFISKFGTQDFTDPSLLNWFSWPSLVCRCAVLPSQVFKM